MYTGTYAGNKPRGRIFPSCPIEGSRDRFSPMIVFITAGLFGPRRSHPQNHARIFGPRSRSWSHCGLREDITLDLFILVHSIDPFLHMGDIFLIPGSFKSPGVSPLDLATFTFSNLFFRLSFFRLLSCVFFDTVIIHCIKKKLLPFRHIFTFH